MRRVQRVLSLLHSFTWYFLEDDILQLIAQICRIVTNQIKLFKVIFELNACQFEGKAMTFLFLVQIRIKKVSTNEFYFVLMIMFPVILWYLMTKSSDLLISVLLWSWIILEEVLRHLPTTAALDAILRLSPEALTRAPPFPHQQHWPVHPTFWKLSTVYSAVLPWFMMVFS